MQCAATLALYHPVVGLDKAKQSMCCTRCSEDDIVVEHDVNEARHHYFEVHGRSSGIVSNTLEALLLGRVAAFARQDRHCY